MGELDGRYGNLPYIQGCADEYARLDASTSFSTGSFGKSFGRSFDFAQDRLSTKLLDIAWWLQRGEDAQARRGACECWECQAQHDALDAAW